MTAGLSDEAKALIQEEEALLARVQDTLREARQTARRSLTPELESQWRALRDEAATATSKELPTLFADMAQVRALMDRDQAAALPDDETPYFAHLRLRTTTGTRDYLLGRATFANTAADVRIVDWRYAPVARIFYAYQEGDEYEEMFPGGLNEGVVEARRVVVIERGALTRILAGRHVLQRDPDGTWHAEDVASVLGGGAGSAARAGFLGTGATRRARADITALLDAEQFEALSASGNRGLLVLGSAGSGKTTVALHRLSKLAFDDPRRFPPQRMSVIVPEPGLARLARRLLDPLGLAHVAVDTLPRWMLHTARRVYGGDAVRLYDDSPALVSRLKRHPALHALLLERIRLKPLAHANLTTVRARVLDLLSDRAFLEAVVRRAQGTLPLSAIDETLRFAKLQLATPLSKELAGIDAERLRTVDGRSIEDSTPDAIAGTVDAEDLAIFLFLRAKAGGLNSQHFAHLVLDEAEDFSLFELAVLGKHLDGKRSVTLAGDEMQQTTPGFAGWPEMLEEIGVGDAGIVRLQVSYRCPKPIADLAQQVLGPLAPEEPARAGRAGAPVGFHRFPSRAQAWLYLADALRDLVDREPDASVALIASGEDVARELYSILEDLPKVRLVLNGEFTFEPGIDVTDVGSVKGLEFDYVVLPDVTASAFPPTDEARRRLHVAVTRASHQLWLVSPGTPSPLLPAA